MAAKGRRKSAAPDPTRELQALCRTLDEGLPPAVVLRGEERFFRTAAARAVLACASARGDEVCRHDAKDPEFAPAVLLDDLTGGALFAGARTILIENAGGLLRKGAREFSQGIVDALLRRLKAALPGCIVLGADSLRADNAVVKAAKAAGGILIGCRRLWDTPPPWDPDPRRSELVQWILGQARERRVKLTPDEAVYLAAAVGNDLAGLVDHLQQLGGRGGRSVAELVGWQAGASPWEVAAALVDGDLKRGAAGVEVLFHGGFQGKDGTRTLDGAALVTILTSAINGRVREAALGAEALARGSSPQQALAAAGVRGGPQAQKAFLARIGRRTPERWRGMLEEAGALERRSRSGAKVDANDLARLALGWAQGRGGS